MDNDVRKLIQFLAEDCGWPLDEDQIDRSAWPVNNYELGLNDGVSIDSVEIYELRPLTTDQPWGIFFLAVKGTSKLSITLLRKLLRGLVKKKRASADTSNLQQWNLEDLMFVCSLDEPENTTRYFAHFKEQEKGLPKLMIGARWQDSQPKSEIEAAKLKLKSNLRWPDDDNDANAWREIWSSAFTVGHKELINSSKALANSLASFAVGIKDNIIALHKIEPEGGSVNNLLKLFQDGLMKDLTINHFADMIAQTLAYGLLSARATTGEIIGIESFGNSIPASNPFLRDFFNELASMQGGGPLDLDFDDIGLSGMLEMLNRENIPSILDDFGNQFRGGKEDPLIHFYESFLGQYNKKLKFDRGVFYTPKSVVSFMVRSVDEHLRNNFGLKDGLADTTTWGQLAKQNPELQIPNGVSEDEAFVKILDPATGTGTFISEVISVIYDTMSKKWRGKTIKEKKELWNDYVQENLLPRVFGLEIMMAPYSICHLNLALKLKNTGFDLGTDQRINVFLTNSLSEPSELSKFMPQFIANETKEVNIVKNSRRFTVILGNPPYSLISSNMEDSHRKLVEKYKFVGKERIKERGALQFEKNLNDDYVKFISLSQEIINSSGYGIFCLITNHSYLDNPTMRGVRWNIMDTSSQIKVIDLHGNSTKKEESPDGKEDKNVFDIKQGVAIILASKELVNDEHVKQVLHSELWGTELHKSEWLNSNTFNSNMFSMINVAQPMFFFIPQDYDRVLEYQSSIPLTDIMKNYGAGYITARDNMVIDFERDSLIKRIEGFQKSNLGDVELLENFNIRTKKGWSVSKARKDLSKVKVEDKIVKTNYRPFDDRWIFYDGSLVWGQSWPTMKHLVKINGNLSLISTRMTKDKWDVMVSRNISSHKAVSAYDTNSIFPLWIIEKESGNKKCSFSLHFVNRVRSHLDYKMGLDKQQYDDFCTKIFCYMYGVLQSESYRNRYRDFLISDFPRIPFTTNRKLFEKIAEKGASLIHLHLLEGKVEPKGITVLGNEELIVEKPTFSDNTIWLNKKQTIGFSGVNEDVWNFKIGGYQVCHKWLKDRIQNIAKNRPSARLSIEEISVYRNIISTIQETIKTKKELDNIIKQSGGFPLNGSDLFSMPQGGLDDNQRTLFS